MKVLLIQSYLGMAETPVYPIGLACLKAELHDCDVRVFDPNLPMHGSVSPYEMLSAVLADFCPQVVGISLRNIDSTNKRKVVFYFTEFVRLLRFVKTRTQAVIVVGGAGFSMFAEVIMKACPEIDFGVFLEGEKTFHELVRHLQSPEAVKSLYYRKYGEIRFTGPGEPFGFEALPDPDMTVVRLPAYLPFADSIGIETKRGCPFQCIYCPYGFLNGKSYRLKDPARIVDQLEYLAKTCGLTQFTFTDSIFNIPVDHAEAILRKLVDRRLTLQWSAWFHERELDETFIQLAIEAGCTKFIFSPDGFSDPALAALGKKLSKTDILRGFHLMAKTSGCEISYNFFKNPPKQSLSAFLALIGFCLKAKWKMGRRVHFEFNSLRVEPHTVLYDMAVAEGIVKREDDVLHPVYYTQRRTKYIEHLFNLALRFAGK
ncbi:B12-binding domain-containing radical SAM protein [Desulfatirhabdium butyrativorans]|uniref:B12-binding domain-containing radical SAM protein n=1 Tax=Desulfatirhabdium butyrativorans TaxID=340467 RepID=UPI0003FEC494|nr:B12-binding domain-containing radical SAM protein [Desulfatirhabdium butyrativorans]